MRRQSIMGSRLSMVSGLGRSWFVFLVLVVAASSCADPASDGSGTAAVSTTVVPNGSESTVTASADPTTTTLAVVTARGGSAPGFADVEEALAEAKDLWDSSSVQAYGYQLNVECDCSEAGSAWARVFPDQPGPASTPVDDLFGRIVAAVEQDPDTLEVAFSATDGHPVSYHMVDGLNELTMTVDYFHPIVEEPSPFDGTWRFGTGTIDDETFQNPVTGGIFLTLSPGYVEFPIDCNRAGGRVDIYDGWFGIGSVFHTDAGCGETPAESALFTESIQRVERIRLEEASLILSGNGVELRFTTPQIVESLGDLPLTAAGELLTFDVPEGRERTDQYIISSSAERPWRNVIYLLTAATPGSDALASWQRWAGEPESTAVSVVGSGPDTIAIPEDIRDGDYALCSPYWEPDLFCFTLRVRPPSAPWIVSAGPAGVVLHNANGTSQTISTEGAGIAFHVDGQLIIQPLDQPDRILVGDGTGDLKEIPLRSGEVLLDVALVNGRAVALTADSSVATKVDLDTGERTPVGAAATAGRLVESAIILHTATNMVRALDLGGNLIWERAIDPDTMVTPVDDGQIRLDRFRVLQREAGPETYFQYLGTEIIDLATGETIDSYEYEIAIPDEGHHIAERCLRTEIRDGLLLCPQPDGRIVTLEVEGGDSRTLVTDARSVTYVRPGQ